MTERKRSTALRDPAWLRFTLLAIALAFVGLFLVLPLVAVFGYAFDKGVDFYLASLADEDARAVGEYGSVIFIAGNLPMVSEIAPLLIVAKLDAYDYAGATAIAVVLLLASFVALFLINVLQLWTVRRRSAEAR